jgi:hypothetical protein
VLSRSRYGLRRSACSAGTSTRAIAKRDDKLGSSAADHPRHTPRSEALSDIAIHG